MYRVAYTLLVDLDQIYEIPCQTDWTRDKATALLWDRMLRASGSPAQNIRIVFDPN